MDAIYRASERFFDGMLNVYRHSLLWVLDNSGLMLVVLLLTIALNVVLIFKIPKGFFPAAGYGSDGGRRAGTAGCILLGDECFHQSAG